MAEGLYSNMYWVVKLKNKLFRLDLIDYLVHNRYQKDKIKLGNIKQDFKVWQRPLSVFER